MKKYLQAGILLILLAVPASIFIFLHVFGENKYEIGVLDVNELAVYNPKVANCLQNVEEGVHRIPAFSLTSQDERTVRRDDFAGKILVSDFFFTTCPSICKQMTTELVRVQEFFSKEPSVHLLSFSVDPTHDTPEVLRDYASLYGADTKRWTFLTGNTEDIYELARCGYFLVAKPNEELANDFIHSDKIVLTDKENRIRGYYSGTDREDVDRLITEIQVLLREYQQQEK